MSKLKFYYGSMNCGKSTLLLQRIHNYESRGMKIGLFKPAIDTKGDREVVSRLGISREVDDLLTADTNFYKLVRNKYSGCSCLFIDEAQFLQREQVDEALQVACQFDLPVECYGLRTDFRTESFPGSRRLLEVADELRELETRCDCGRKATLVGRFKNGVMALDGAQVEIDNQEEIKYISYCPKCYFKQKLKARQKLD